MGEMSCGGNRFSVERCFIILNVRRVTGVSVRKDIRPGTGVSVRKDIRPGQLIAKESGISASNHIVQCDEDVGEEFE